MAKTTRARELMAQRKAKKVARYYCAYKNFLHKEPSISAIARKFGRSFPWAARYFDLAREMGLLV